MLTIKLLLRPFMNILTSLIYTETYFFQLQNLRLCKVIPVPRSAINFPWAIVNLSGKKGQFFFFLVEIETVNFWSKNGQIMPIVNALHCSEVLGRHSFDTCNTCSLAILHRLDNWDSTRKYISSLSLTRKNKLKCGDAGTMVSTTTTTATTTMTTMMMMMTMTTTVMMQC